MTHLLVVKSGYALEPIDSLEDIEDASEGLTLEVVTHKRAFDQIVGWFRARIRNIA